jgi:hypothetical protein
VLKLHTIGIALRLASTPPKNTRVGQHFFNSLYTLNSVAANSIRGTELDPFFDDDILPECVKHLIEKAQNENSI